MNSLLHNPKPKHKPTINETHGMSYTVFYKKYGCMKRRCSGRYKHDHKAYTLKGIRNMWNSFEAFKTDMFDSYVAHVKENGSENTTLDRIDPNGNYCKENCRWATYTVQNRNRSNYPPRYLFKGEMLLLVDIGKKIGISPNTLSKRLRFGWSPERAFSEANRIYKPYRESVKWGKEQLK